MNAQRPARHPCFHDKDLSRGWATGWQRPHTQSTPSRNHNACGVSGRIGGRPSLRPGNEARGRRLCSSVLQLAHRSVEIFVTEMLARRRPRLQGLGAVASGNPEIPESTLGQKVFSFLVTHPRPPSFDGSNTKRFPDFLYPLLTVCMIAASSSRSPARN